MTRPSSRRTLRLRACVQAVVLTLIMLFIALPLVVVAWTSIQSETYPGFPPAGLSMRWWHEALTAQWLLPIAQSLVIGAAAALLATVLGTCAACGLAKSTGRMRSLVDGFLATPLLLPELVIGLALLQLVSQLNARYVLGMPLLIAAHAVVGIPFVVRTVSVSLAGIDERWERAAADLGASGPRTFVHVTLPLIKSGIFAGSLFAFITSFNNVELSLFLVTRQDTPIPIAILQYMDYEYSPVLAAVAVLTVVPVLITVAIAAKFVRLTSFIYDGRK